MTNKEAADLLVSLHGEWPAFPPAGIHEALLRATAALETVTIIAITDRRQNRVDL